MTNAPMHWRGDPGEIVVEHDDDAYRRAFMRRLDLMLPDWHRDALCREFDTSLWFPARGERNQPALDICGRCAVRIECLDWAIDQQFGHGVFGGMSPAARRAHARARGEP